VSTVGGGGTEVCANGKRPGWHVRIVSVIYRAVAAHCQTDRSRSTIGVGPEITARTGATSGPHQPLHPSADVAQPYKRCLPPFPHLHRATEPTNCSLATHTHPHAGLTAHRVSIAAFYTVWPAYIRAYYQVWKREKEVPLRNLVPFPHIFLALSSLHLSSRSYPLSFVSFLYPGFLSQFP